MKLVLLSVLVAASLVLQQIQAFRMHGRHHHHRRHRHSRISDIPSRINCDCFAYLRKAEECGWTTTDEEIEMCASDPTSNLTSEAFGNFQYWCNDVNLHHDLLRAGDKTFDFIRQLTCRANLAKDVRKSIQCGVVKTPNPVKKPSGGVKFTGRSCKYSTTTFVKSSDWRNITTATRDQNVCGCCWAMVATEMCESYQRQVKKINTKLSVQNLISCDSANYGCDGGFVDLAGNYINSTGLVTDATYPFVSGSTASSENCYSYAAKKTKCPKVITETYEYTDRSGNCNRLKQLLQYGPVGIYMMADDNGFYQYSSGVFSTNTLQGTTDTSVDHAVLAVGVTTVNGVEAFIIQNSWGTSWGQNGFVYVKTSGNQLNICSHFFYYNVRNLSC